MKKQVFKIIICYFMMGVVDILMAAEPGAILRGKVYDDSTYQPLIAATIYILGTNIGACTNINGSYEIYNIPPGKYLLKISLIGFFIQYTDSILFDAGSIVNQDFYLTTGLMSTIETNVPKKDSIGKGTLEGILLDDNKKWLGYEACIQIQGTRLGVMCDSDGYYRIENLPPGTYSIKASGIGFFQRVVNNVIIEPHKVRNLCISMVRNNTFIITDPIMPLTGGIAGTVYDGYTGSPIADATIIMDDNKVISSSNFTSGNYYYDQIPPGIHSFTTTRHGYKKWLIMDIDIKRNRLFAQDIVLFPVILGEPAVKYPGKVAKLEGTIRDLEKICGISGVTICVEGLDARTQILKPKNPYEGKYSIDWLPPGIYKVKVYLNGFGQQETNNVIIVKGKTTICDFNLIPDSDK
jgi:large repetitive protein